MCNQVTEQLSHLWKWHLRENLKEKTKERASELPVLLEAAGEEECSRTYSLINMVLWDYVRLLCSELCLRCSLNEPLLVALCLPGTLLGCRDTKTNMLRPLLRGLSEWGQLGQETKAAWCKCCG